MLFVGFVGFAVEEEEGQIRERSPTKQLAQPAWKRVTAFNELMKLHSYLHSKNYHKRKPKKNKRQLTSWSRIYSTYCYHQIAIIPTFCDIWCILSLLTYSLAILDLWAFLAFSSPRSPQAFQRSSDTMAAFTKRPLQEFEWLEMMKQLALTKFISLTKMMILSNRTQESVWFG